MFSCTRGHSVFIPLTTDHVFPIYAPTKLRHRFRHCFRILTGGSEQGRTAHLQVRKNLQNNREPRYETLWGIDRARGRGSRRSALLRGGIVVQPCFNSWQLIYARLRRLEGNSSFNVQRRRCRWVLRQERLVISRATYWISTTDYHCSTTNKINACQIDSVIKN